MDTLIHDVRFGLRMLMKARSFTFASVITLILGIGSSMTMFALVEGPVLNRPPIGDLNKIANVWITDERTDRGRLSPASFLDLRSRAAAFEELSAFADSEKVLTGTGEPRRIEVLTVSANFFRMLGVSPMLGRIFGEGEDRPANSLVAIISQRIWHTDFGRESDVIGKTIHLDGLPYRVVGVMPSSFWFPSQGAEAWIPLVLDSSNDRAPGTLMVAGRLQKNVSFEQANAQAQLLARALAYKPPFSEPHTGIRIIKYESELNRKGILGIAFVLGPSFLVLLIGCANITNLLLARGFARQAEFATRAALGAAPSRVLRQLFAEYFVLTAIGAVAGIFAAYVAIAALRRAFQSVNPTLADTIRLNGPVLAFGTIAALFIPLVFGLIPALRSTNVKLNESLRQNGVVVGAQISLKRLPLVVFEIGLAMLLLIVAGLFIRTFVAIERTAPPRIDTGRVVTFTVSVRKGDAGTLITGLTAVPGVRSVGTVTDLPLLADTRDEDVLTMDFNGRSTETTAVQMHVDSGFFDVFQLSPVRGRLPFPGEISVGVASEAFARQHGVDIIGLKIRQGNTGWVTVVGVVRNWLFDPRTGDPLPIIYFSRSPDDTTFQVVARTETGTALIPELKRAVSAWDPNEPVENCQTIAQALRNDLAGPDMIVRIFTVFALLSLALASVGVYGVMNYSTTRRIREIGIRIALGATPGGILKLVLWEATLLMVVGISLGWVIGLAAARLVSHELVVTPTDPINSVVSAAVIWLTGLVAAYAPARRAALIDPMTALRFE